MSASTPSATRTTVKSETRPDPAPDNSFDKHRLQSGSHANSENCLLGYYGKETGSPKVWPATLLAAPADGSARSSLGLMVVMPPRCAGDRHTRQHERGLIVKRALVCSPKGGAGKTFLTRCLAVAAAREGLSVATADLDPQETLTKWVRRRPAEAIPLCHYAVTWEDVDLLVTEGSIELCDVLFIDTPPSVEMYPAKLKRLVVCSDLVLVPCRPSYDDVESAAPFLRALREHGCPVFAVLNATAPRINVNFEKGLLAEAADVCPIELRQRIDHTRASARGLSVADFPSHEGAKEIEAVWKFVRRHLMGTKEGSRVAA